MLQTIVLTVIAAFFGGAVQASAGFGIAIVMMVILPAVMPAAEFSILIPFVGLPSIGFLAIKHRRDINYKLLILPAILASTLLIISFRIMLATDNTLVIRILGGFFIALAIYSLCFSDKIRIPANRVTASISGVVSGVLSGFFNINGPIMAMYYVSATKDKNEYYATLQAFFTICIIARVLYVILFIEVPSAILLSLPLSIGAAILGMLAGGQIFKRLSKDNTEKAIYILMLLSGAWFLLS